MTKDGVVVVSHDPAFNPDITRGPDGKWLEKTGPAIWSLTFKELQRYDVGRLNPANAYAKRWPEQQAGRRHAYPAACRPVRAGEEEWQRSSPLQHRDQDLAARAG